MPYPEMPSRRARPRLLTTLLLTGLLFFSGGPFNDANDDPNGGFFVAVDNTFEANCKLRTPLFNLPDIGQDPAKFSFDVFSTDLYDGLFQNPLSVNVLDENNKVMHSQLVSEIASEPDYQAALDALGN